MPDQVAQTLHELIVATRILSHEKVLDAFGHVSVRHPHNPQHYFIPRHRPPELAEVSDIVELNLDSQPVEPTDWRLYSERVIYGEIYKARPEVNAVVHHHAHTVLPFAISGREIVPVFHLAAVIGQVPVWDQRDEFGDTNMLVVKPEEGASLARALGPHWMVLMRRHGATVAGTSLRELTFRTVFGSDNCKLLSQALTHGGTVDHLSAGEIESVLIAQRAAALDQPGVGLLGAASGEGRTDAGARQRSRQRRRGQAGQAKERNQDHRQKFSEEPSQAGGQARKGSRQGSPPERNVIRRICCCRLPCHFIVCGGHCPNGQCALWFAMRYCNLHASGGKLGSTAAKLAGEQ